MSFGVPLGGVGGISQPLAKYKFRVSIENFEKIQPNLISIEIEAVQKRLELRIRETILGETLFEIERMRLSENVELFWDSLENGDNVVFQQHLTGLKIIGHKLQQSYESPNAVEHILTLTYETRAVIRTVDLP